MPLDFSHSEPWTKEDCVYIMGRYDNSEVLCKVPFETLFAMRKGSNNPVEIYLANRNRLETIFSKLWDHGHLDEDGNVKFSTGIHECPEILI